MFNTYKLINFQIKTEFLINYDDYNSIKDFDKWFDHLNDTYLDVTLEERFFNSTKLKKIVNIQNNILSEILFIIERYGEHKISLIKLFYF